MAVNTATFYRDPVVSLDSESSIEEVEPVLKVKSDVPYSRDTDDEDDYRPANSTNKTRFVLTSSDDSDESLHGSSMPFSPTLEEDMAAEEEENRRRLKDSAPPEESEEGDDEEDEDFEGDASSSNGDAPDEDEDDDDDDGEEDEDEEKVTATANNFSMNLKEEVRLLSSQSRNL